MNWLNVVFWWVGAVICATGASVVAVSIPVIAADWIWKNCVDLEVALTVVREANKQGRSIWRRSNKN